MPGCEERFRLRGATLVWFMERWLKKESKKECFCKLVNLAHFMFTRD